MDMISYLIGKKHGGGGSGGSPYVQNGLMVETSDHGIYATTSASFPAVIIQDLAVLFPNYEYSDTMTFETCFKIDKITASGYSYIVDEVGTGNGARNGIGISINSNYLYYHSGVGGYFNHYTGVAYTLGDLKTVTVTRERPDTTTNTYYFKCWINGAEIQSAAHSGSYTISTDPHTTLAVFCSTSGSSSYSNMAYGRLYSHRIYNRILTADEITANYNADVAQFGG